jgi:hypothetical protein
MTGRAWLVFVVIQIFGEVSSYAGSHTTTVMGPILWLFGMILMMPGRIIALFFVERSWWTGHHSSAQDAAAMVVIEVLVNALAWVAIAKVSRLVRRRG